MANATNRYGLTDLMAVRTEFANGDPTGGCNPLQTSHTICPWTERRVADNGQEVFWAIAWTRAQVEVSGAGRVPLAGR